MKKYLFLSPVCLMALASCGGNGNKAEDQQAQGPTFAPKQQTETVVTKHPVSRRVDSVLAFVGQVKLKIMLPEGLPENSKYVLHN